MITKFGVDTDHLNPIVQAALPVLTACRLEALAQCLKLDMTVTAGCEGTPADKVHMPTSLHYRQNCPGGEGLAVDLRTRDFVDLWATLVRAALGSGWDVVVEGDHLHCERDPKKVPLEKE